MSDKQLVQLSKWLSLRLRHDPAGIGICEFDIDGVPLAGLDPSAGFVELETALVVPRDDGLQARVVEPYPVPG